MALDAAKSRGAAHARLAGACAPPRRHELSPVLKRLLTFWRPRPERPKEGATYRLCRLRHATLHPGATLWTPGVGGGNLGGGAANALDEAGLGGEVVVGFQSGAREPVHTFGVLARIEERVPFPESWNPEGLGASHRYRLTGLARVEIDPGSQTHKRVPTALAKPALPRAEDTAPPPPELVELLLALSRLDNAWPEHWLEAFSTLPGAPLGQWATTLGWRLSREERLMLFDQPNRIAEVLLSTLDALHLGLAPERRREAVRAQTLTRRTSYMPERTMEVIGDEDGWAFFHPADVHGVAAEQEPRAEAIETHFQRGNAIAVRSVPGRRCRVRLTAGDLGEDEARRRGPEASFRLLVRHGRLFLGGATLLRAGAYQERLEFAEPRQWLDIPNGVYRAIVTAIEPPSHSDEPTVDLGAAESSAPTLGDDTPLSEYVVQLRGESTLEDIAVPDALPEL